MQASKFRLSWIDWGLLLFLSLLWGGSFLYMRVAVREIPVFTVALGRIGIAAVVLTVYVYLRGHRLPLSRKMWRRFMILGLLRAALPISLFVYAGTQIDSNVSGILNSTTPLFTALVAHVFTQDERLTASRFVGILIGMLGVVFLMGPAALQGLGGNVVAQLAILGATLCYGFATVYGRGFRDVPVTVSTAGLLISSTIMIAPVALLIDKPWTLTPSTVSILAVLALAILSTAVAFMVWLVLVLRVGANNTSLVTFIIPINAIVLGAVFLGEAIEWYALLGLGLILLGLVITQGWLALRQGRKPVLMES